MPSWRRGLGPGGSGGAAAASPRRLASARTHPSWMALTSAGTSWAALSWQACHRRLREASLLAAAAARAVAEEPGVVGVLPLPAAAALLHAICLLG